jgi:nucleoside-diphosphate-sugar epimerase
MKYFVTGATGFIGGRLAKQLRDANHEVIALVRDPEKARHLAAIGVQLAEGDVTDKESMRAPMTGVDGLFHVAGWYKVGVRNTDAGVQININGTRNVLELMRDLHIPKGVYTSTLAVNSDTHGKMVDETYRYDGPHLTEYDRTKWAAHRQVAEPLVKASLPLVTVMPGMVYGPGDTSDMRATFVQYLQGRLPMVPQRFALCWAHVDDIARGHVLAMEKGRAGEDYIIAGEPKTFVDVLKMAEEITGIPAPRMQAPPVMFKISAALVGLIEGIVKLPAAYTSEGMRTIAGTTYWGDNSKARRELGYNPRPLSEGLPDMLRYEMAQLGMAPKVAHGAG